MFYGNSAFLQDFSADCFIGSLIYVTTSVFLSIPYYFLIYLEISHILQLLQFQKRQLSTALPPVAAKRVLEVSLRPLRGSCSFASLPGQPNEAFGSILCIVFRIPVRFMLPLGQAQGPLEYSPTYFI